MRRMNSKSHNLSFRTLSCLATMFLCSVSLFAQEPDSTLGIRTKLQLDYVWKYLKQHKRPEPFKSTAEIDSLMGELVTNWSIEIGDKNPALKRFGSYAYIISYLYFFPDMKPEWRWLCHVWSNYILPAFLEEFEYFKKEPTKRKANLITASNNVFTIGRNCSLPNKNEWVGLLNAYKEMPNIIDAYLTAEAFERPDVRDRLRDMKIEFVRQESAWTIKDLIFESRLDEAFVELAAAFSERQSPPEYFVHPAKDLVDRYRENVMTSKALAVLDLLARSTSEVDLPRDSLKVWYAQVNPEKGTELFKSAIKQGGALSLVSSGERVELSGQFADLITGKIVDLNTLSGKIVLLDFWTTWCTPCVAEIPNLVEFASRHNKRSDFAFVTICSDAYAGGQSEDKVRDFVKQKGIDYLVLYDTQKNSLSERFGVKGFPSKFLLNRRGEYLVRPFFEKDRRASLEMVEAYLKSLE